MLPQRSPPTKHVPLVKKICSTFICGKSRIIYRISPEWCSGIWMENQYMAGARSAHTFIIYIIYSHSTYTYDTCTFNTIQYNTTIITIKCKLQCNDYRTESVRVYKRYVYTTTKNSQFVHSSLIMAFTSIGDNSHANSLSRTKHNSRITLPTLTAN